MATSEDILDSLKSLAKPANLPGMQRYGINTSKALGVSIPALRQIARKVGKSHPLAEELWAFEIHEARILASMIEDPRQVGEEQMESWVSEFDSWDVCDQVCSNLFDRTPLAFQKAQEWSTRDPEFVKRAGFVLIACLAAHDKKAKDEQFEVFFAFILQEASDERNFVKKAINWALRGIGKRNHLLNQKAIHVAQKMQLSKSKAARWIASDALRELTSEAVQRRVRTKNNS